MFQIEGFDGLEHPVHLFSRQAAQHLVLVLLLGGERQLGGQAGQVAHLVNRYWVTGDR